jgi:hypothetical protein
MRSTTFVTTALLTLALASVAVADDKRGNRYPDDRYGRYDRYDRNDRYDSRGTERVAVLAHEIEETAASIRRQAERNNRRPDRSEARMLAALRELHEEANHFHDQVEQGSRRGSHSSRDFGQLLDAYDFTAESLRYVSRRPYVDRGMERIGYLIDEISRAYGYNQRDRHRDGHGRYGDRYNHDRYDRRH